jgi:hypothetical protein
MSFPGPPSWRPDGKSRSDRRLAAIGSLAVILIAVVAVAIFLYQSGGLEGVLANLGLVPGG